METTIICFWCRQHVTPAELIDGRHDHVDERERLQAAQETKKTS